ncbi:MAG: butyrate kinase [Oscillospiraceae bacterium]|nr:butyrate kinase [Oscillospiraceae bacterium]
MKTYTILAVNPGSTSTKVALFENDRVIFSESISHTRQDLERFETIQQQLPFRRQVVMECLQKHGCAPEDIDVFVGRGGGLVPTEGGVYIADELLTEHASRGMRGEHPAQLASQICKALADKYSKRAYIVNPPDTDEFEDISRVSGVKGYYRESHIHTLNQKEVALRWCESRGLRYGDVNLIVCHLGGGISVTAHRRGRMIDSNDIMKGSGPMTPTRAGEMPYLHIVDMAYSGQYTKQELTAKLNKRSGLIGYFGTDDARTVMEMIDAGDEQAKLIFDAMIYQTAKYIGSMAVALKGEFEAIILTGGLSRSGYITDMIRQYAGWMGSIEIIPGELEMEALVAGALRVETGQEKAKRYTGIPVWDGMKNTY